MLCQTNLVVMMVIVVVVRSVQSDSLDVLGVAGLRQPDLPLHRRGAALTLEQIAAAAPGPIAPAVVASRILFAESVQVCSALVAVVADGAVPRYLGCEVGVVAVGELREVLRVAPNRNRRAEEQQRARKHLPTWER